MHPSNCHSIETIALAQPYLLASRCIVAYATRLKCLPHIGFNLGTGKHVVEINVSKDGTVEVASGVEGLTLLKTTQLQNYNNMDACQSGFVGFIRDKYTLLPETTERMLATEVCAVWRSVSC
eukprot:Gb_00686 [translate_table: standard]